MWVSREAAKNKRVPSVAFHQYSLLTDEMTFVSCHYNPVLDDVTSNPGQKLENVVCEYTHALVILR